MTSTTIAVGELIYDATLNFTSVTEYGVSMETLISGQTTPPPEGARVDVAFEGVTRGPKLKGAITGVDYLHIRADGRTQLHIHAELTTEDAEKISIFAEGVATLQEATGLFQISVNYTFTTSSPAYSWINQLPVWGQGTVDLAKGEINVKGYVAA